MNYLKSVLGRMGLMDGGYGPGPLLIGGAPSNIGNDIKRAQSDWAQQQADKEFAQDYKMRELGLLEQLGQLPQRGNQRPNIGGRARMGSDFGMNPQAIDRQRNPGQFQPPERPRIVNNLTQLLRPFQG